MSHDPRPPPVRRPLALALAGGRAGAMATENAWRRHFAGGLDRLAETGAADPRAALEALDACAPGRIGRYNEESEETPGAGV